MLHRAFVILSLILFSPIIAGPTQGSDMVLKKLVRISDHQIPTILSSQKTLKSGNQLLQSPGTIIDSTYYDWQSNGGLDDHLGIFEDGSTVKVSGTMMVAYQQDTSDRTMAFYHWNGQTWIGHGQTILPVRNGFGSMSAFSDGRMAICTHGDADGNGTRCWAGFNAWVGSPTFSWNGTSMTNPLIWPRISVNSDGSICMTGIDQVTSDVWIAKAQDSVSGFGEWYLNFRDLASDWIDDDMEWPTIHSGTAGKVGVVIPDYAGSLRLFESTDNGESFDVITIAPADTANLPSEPDSTAPRNAWINTDIMYIGDDPHIVWTAGQGAKDGDNYGLIDFKTTIFHWSPSTGIDTVVVAPTQSADSSRTDYVRTPFNHLSVDWPSIGLAVDGRTLVVAYTAFNPEDLETELLSYIDIWMTTSPDNGETWMDPQNVTNPDGTVLGWDDRYPSIAKFNLDNAADPGKDVYMIYQSDVWAGSYIDRRGPQSEWPPNYIKFVGVDLAAVSIGDGGGRGSGDDIPKVFSLSQNYPNPFNPSTTIRYSIPGGNGSVQVKVFIYDIRGRLVRKLVDQEKEPGRYQIHWDGRDEKSQQVSSGVYLYRIDAGEFISTRKMLLVR